MPALCLEGRSPAQHPLALPVVWATQGVAGWLLAECTQGLGKVATACCAITQSAMDRHRPAHAAVRGSSVRGLREASRSALLGGVNPEFEHAIVGNDLDVNGAYLYLTKTHPGASRFSENPP
jgi:hypothetical protein